MRGGKNATVTDANLILGYLDENYFLGGKMKVDKALAIKSVNDNIAGPLGLDVIESAYAIWSTVTVNMTEAIRNITLWEGIDPRDYVVVVGGGATALHAASIVEQLGAKKAIIPKTASTLSAFGGAIADIVSEFSRSFFTTTKEFSTDDINEVLAALKSEAQEFLDKVGVPKKSQVLEFYVEARYPFQERELRIPVNGEFVNKNDIVKLEEDFNMIHEKTLGSKEEGQYIECTLWKVRAIGITPGISLPEIEQGSELAPAAAMKHPREAYFKELGGMVEVQVYAGNKVLAGNKIVGPSIIEEETTTIIIPPKCMATVSKHGNYIVEIL
jgi:N-methylhydantoinase A